VEVVGKAPEAKVEVMATAAMVSTNFNVELTFKKLDLDGHGSIDLNAMKFAVKKAGLGNVMPDPHVEILFKTVDTNADGRIDLAEFTTACVAAPVEQLVTLQKIAGLSVEVAAVPVEENTEEAVDVNDIWAQRRRASKNSPKVEFKHIKRTEPLPFKPREILHSDFLRDVYNFYEVNSVQGGHLDLNGPGFKMALQEVAWYFGRNLDIEAIASDAEAELEEAPNFEDFMECLDIVEYLLDLYTIRSLAVFEHKTVAPTSALSSLRANDDDDEDC